MAISFVKIVRTAGGTVSSNVWTNIHMQDVEFDTDGWFDPALPGSVTVPAGISAISCSYNVIPNGFQGTSPDYHYRFWRIRGEETLEFGFGRIFDTGWGLGTIIGSGLVSVLPGDIIQPWVHSNDSFGLRTDRSVYFSVRGLDQ